MVSEAGGTLGIIGSLETYACETYQIHQKTSKNLLFRQSETIITEK